MVEPSNDPPLLFLGEVRKTNEAPVLEGTENGSHMRKVAAPADHVRRRVLVMNHRRHKTYVKKVADGRNSFMRPFKQFLIHDDVMVRFPQSGNGSPEVAVPACRRGIDQASPIRPPFPPREQLWYPSFWLSFRGIEEGRNHISSIAEEMDEPTVGNGLADLFDVTEVNW